MGRFPQMREWIGPRHVKGLEAYGFTIRNRRFESTVGVPRTDIADDRLAIFKPVFSEMGQHARRHPEQLVLGLLKSGFETEGYDGQPFFDTDHAVKLNEAETVSVSNMQAGGGPAWFLLDTSRRVRPIIWQEREACEFQALTSNDDQHVFINDEYLYGVRARVNAGFGLWQLAFGSKAALTAENYAAARAAMMDFRADGGDVLGISPNLLIVPRRWKPPRCIC